MLRYALLYTRHSHMHPLLSAPALTTSSTFLFLLALCRLVFHHLHALLAVVRYLSMSSGLVCKTIACWLLYHIVHNTR